VSAQSGRGQDIPSCVRHPDRPTGLRCTRCDRPACVDCLVDASVGHQCVDCVRDGSQETRQPRPARRSARAGQPRLVVVPGLIAVNVAVFVLTAVQAGGISTVEISPVFRDGVLVPALVSDGQWWRLVTSGFLHVGNYGGYGPVHLLFNMLALFLIGRDLESALGRARFLVVYLVALLGGSTAVMLFGAADGSVAGASGAIYGLFGGIAVVVFKLKLNPGPVLTLVVINIVLSVALPGISLLGHIGGLVAGTLAAAAMVYAPAARRVVLQSTVCGALVVVMLVMIGVRGSALDCTASPDNVMVSCAEGVFD
jgi:membrane associated rhomboid family serine protease